MLTHLPADLFYQNLMIGSGNIGASAIRPGLKSCCFLGSKAVFTLKLAAQPMREAALLTRTLGRPTSLK